MADCMLTTALIMSGQRSMHEIERANVRSLNDPKGKEVRIINLTVKGALLIFYLIFIL